MSLDAQLRDIKKNIAKLPAVCDCDVCLKAPDTLARCPIGQDLFNLRKAFDTHSVHESPVSAPKRKLDPVSDDDSDSDKGVVAQRNAVLKTMPYDITATYDSYCLNVIDDEDGEEDLNADLVDWIETNYCTVDRDIGAIYIKTTDEPAELYATLLEMPDEIRALLPENPARKHAKTSD